MEVLLWALEKEDAYGQVYIVTMLAKLSVVPFRDLVLS
jgi:hypothetical protein